MTEKEFHKQRRMFAIIDNILFIADIEDCRSHQEWIRDVFNIKEPQLRGYVDSTGIYFYSTCDCRATGRDLERIQRHLAYLKYKLRLDSDLPVHQGVIIGEVGTRWLPAKTVGILKDFIYHDYSKIS